MFLVWLLYAYFLIGFLFALVFVFVGAKALDPDARNTTVWFKLIIIPGGILLWPFLLIKWIKSRRNEY